MAAESIRARFTGNTCFYVYAARHRGKIFLNRNIAKVLREWEVSGVRGENLASRVSTPPTTDVDVRLSNEFRARSTARIDHIINKLRPPLPTGRDEPVLKIEVRSLKRKRFSKPRSNGSGLG